MDSGGLGYFPLALPFLAFLAGLFVVLVAFVEVRALRFAYMRVGLSSRGALLLLLASLAGSYLNIPVAQLPGHAVVAYQDAPFLGLLHYRVPYLVQWPGTVIAVNVGGAVIPGLLSLYLIVRTGQFLRALVAIACVTLVVHRLAYPVPGLGIAVPVFVPPIAAAIVAVVLSREYAPALAYVGGALGTLIGADLLNLRAIERMGAPVASIGGAGTFDGIFVTGVLAVLLASLVSPRAGRPAPA